MNLAAHRGPPPRALCLLTVFADARQRAEVGDLCARLAPDCRMIHTATATDAVMALLSEEVDLVLVDVVWAGDLLGALVRHVHRALPQADVVGFFSPSGEGALRGYLPPPRERHTWEKLPAVLTQWLAGRRPVAARV